MKRFTIAAFVLLFALGSMTACSTTERYVGTGALVGAGIGAAAAGNPGAGALVGGATGAGVGYLLSRDKSH